MIPEDINWAQNHGVNVTIHPKANVRPLVRLGNNCKVWQFADVGADLGNDCVVGHGSQINPGATIGNFVRINSLVIICANVTLEDFVFVAGGCITVEDLRPNLLSPQATDDPGYQQDKNRILVCKGARLGVGSIILPGVTIGAGALVGAGAVVTKDVAPGTTVIGNPARTMLDKQAGEAITKELVEHRHAVLRARGWPEEDLGGG